MLTRTMFAVCVLLFSVPAQSQTFAIAGGQTIRASNTEHDAYRAEMNFGWKPEIWTNDKWALSLHHALSIRTFRDVNTVNAISWAPNLILTPSRKNGIYPYAQLGFGIAYLSDDYFESKPKPSPYPMYPRAGITDMGSHGQFESSLHLA